MKISKEIKTGIVVIVAIALFVYGFNFLKGKDIFSSRDLYYAVYPQVSGLVEANPVQVNGFKVGRIKKIELMDTSGMLLVTMAISDDKIRITKGTVAKIVSPEFLGGKAIELVLGKSSDYAPDGDTLISEIDPSLQASVNETIRPLKEKAEKLIGSIDSIMAVVQAVLDVNTRENLNKSFASIKHALETFDRTAMRLDTMMASERYKISAIFSRVESISTNLANNNENIAHAIQNFAAISDTIAKSNFSKTVENANKALSDVSAVMERINKGEGSAGMLVKDDKLYKNLSAASASVDSLIKDMEINPWRYFSLRGKKHRTKKSKP